MVKQWNILRFSLYIFTLFIIVYVLFDRVNARPHPSESVTDDDLADAFEDADVWEEEEEEDAEDDVEDDFEDDFEDDGDMDDDVTEEDEETITAAEPQKATLRGNMGAQNMNQASASSTDVQAKSPQNTYKSLMRDLFGDDDDSDSVVKTINDGTKKKVVDIEDGSIITMLYDDHDTRFLTRCEGCGTMDARFSSANGSIQDITQFERWDMKIPPSRASYWRVEYVSDTQLRLRGDNGRYLQRTSVEAPSLYAKITTSCHYVGVDAISPKSNGTIWTLRKASVFWSYNLFADDGSSIFLGQTMPDVISKEKVGITCFTSMLPSKVMIDVVNEKQILDAYRPYVRTVSGHVKVAPFSDGDYIVMSSTDSSKSLQIRPSIVNDVSYYAIANDRLANVDHGVYLAPIDASYRDVFRVKYWGAYRDGVVSLQNIDGRFVGLSNATFTGNASILALSDQPILWHLQTSQMLNYWSFVLYKNGTNQAASQCLSPLGASTDLFRPVGMWECTNEVISLDRFFRVEIVKAEMIQRVLEDRAADRSWNAAANTNDVPFTDAPLNQAFKKLFNANATLPMRIITYSSNNNFPKDLNTEIGLATDKIWYNTERRKYADFPDLWTGRLVDSASTLTQLQFLSSSGNKTFVVGGVRRVDHVADKYNNFFSGSGARVVSTIPSRYPIFVRTLAEPIPWLVNITAIGKNFVDWAGSTWINVTLEHPVHRGWYFATCSSCAWAQPPDPQYKSARLPLALLRTNASDPDVQWTLVTRP